MKATMESDKSDRGHQRQWKKMETERSIQIPSALKRDEMAATRSAFNGTALANAIKKNALPCSSWFTKAAFLYLIFQKAL
jgi:hypothetical protein